MINFKATELLQKEETPMLKIPEGIGEILADVQEKIEEKARIREQEKIQEQKELQEYLSWKQSQYENSLEGAKYILNWTKDFLSTEEAIGIKKIFSKLNENNLTIFSASNFYHCRPTEDYGAIATLWIDFSTERLCYSERYKWFDAGEHFIFLTPEQIAINLDPDYVKLAQEHLSSEKMWETMCALKSIDAMWVQVPL